jgi:hypothetical protein
VADDAEAARLEYRLRLLVVPVTLGLAWLLTATGGRMVGRIFFSMWLHELGHAVAAWFCGIPAFPGPWITPMAGSRSVGVSLLLAGALAAFGYWRYRRHHLLGVVVAAVLLFLQLVLTVAVPLRGARVFVTFCGDGGGLVLGTLLMATFYVGADHALRTRQLRWGFVVIGAYGFADPLRTWWAARTDLDAIPYGRSEAAGLSDPSRLEAFGWSAPAMTSAYLRLAALCLLVLLGVHLWGVWQARRALRG